VAIGGALRQWARSAGHESISSVAPLPAPPPAALVALVSPYHGSDALPSDVYAAIIGPLQGDPAAVADIVAAAGGDGVAAAARAFLRGVWVGAAAYDPPSS
jgi:hypothetical protein